MSPGNAATFAFLGCMACVTAMIWAVCWAAVKINAQRQKDDPPR